jgi:hypothetical protein
LRFFADRVLRKVFGTKRKEMAVGGLGEDCTGMRYITFMLHQILLG